MSDKANDEMLSICASKRNWERGGISTGREVLGKEQEKEMEE